MILTKSGLDKALYRYGGYSNAPREPNQARSHAWHGEALPWENPQTSPPNFSELKEESTKRVAQ